MSNFFNSFYQVIIVRKLIYITIVCLLYLAMIQTVSAVEEYQFSTQWGSYGGGAGQFSEPHGIGVDNNGYVYVADHSNQRIQKFTSEGIFIKEWSIGGTPHGLNIDKNGYIYTDDGGNHYIRIYDSNGVFLNTLGSGQGSAAGQFRWPMGSAVDRLRQHLRR